MKRVHTLTCWTDYPFVELSDVEFEKAPIRHVNVVRFDGNKYATVSFDDNGFQLQVKAGYLYTRPMRLTIFKTWDFDQHGRPKKNRLSRAGTPRRVSFRKLERMYKK